MSHPSNQVECEFSHPYHANLVILLFLWVPSAESWGHSISQKPENSSKCHHVRLG